MTCQEGCGVNNTLDILLLVGETCLCASSLIAYSVESKMQSEAEENTPSLAVTTNANANLNGTASLVQQQEPLAKLIAKHYPVANAIIAIFDILGLIIFLSCFLYFFKEMFVHVCGRICDVDENKEKITVKNIYLEKKSSQIVPN